MDKMKVFKVVEFNEDVERDGQEWCPGYKVVTGEVIECEIEQDDMGTLIHLPDGTVIGYMDTADVLHEKDGEILVYESMDILATNDVRYEYYMQLTEMM